MLDRWVFNSFRSIERLRLNESHCLLWVWLKKRINKTCFGFNHIFNLISMLLVKLKNQFLTQFKLQSGLEKSLITREILWLCFLIRTEALREDGEVQIISMYCGSIYSRYAICNMLGILLCSIWDVYLAYSLCAYLQCCMYNLWELAFDFYISTSDQHKGR